nr:hypothetical protein [Tanacetum cinerariifolium]
NRNRTLHLLRSDSVGPGCLAAPAAELSTISNPGARVPSGAPVSVGLVVSGDGKGSGRDGTSSGGEGKAACLAAAGAARQPGPTESDLRRCRVDQAGYGITDTWDEIFDKLMEIAPTTLEGVNERVTELDTTVRQRTDEFEIRFEEAQDDQALLRARVNTLFRDRQDHRRTAMLMDREAMNSCEAWSFSMDRSSAIAAHVRTLETQVAALITQTTSLQTQLTTSLGRIEILEARDPEPQEGPAEAGSSCYSCIICSYPL